MARTVTLLLLLAACAGPRVDYSARRHDRFFLHEGMREREVIDAWGKPDDEARSLDNGKVVTTWLYDRIYKQKPEIAYWPRSKFSLSFVEGRLRWWSVDDR